VRSVRGDLLRRIVEGEHSADGLDQPGLTVDARVPPPFVGGR
jgi:hypothetical protein